MNIRELMARPGEPISAARWNELVKLVEKLLDGPQVVAPLAIQGGAIYLAQDFEAIDGITDSSFGGRVGGTMASGQVRLVLARNATLTTLTNSAGLVTAYNWTGGTIPSNIRVVLVRIADSYRIIAADCSGVAP